MNISSLETKIVQIEESLAKSKELIVDYKNCSSEISKTLLMSALKKYLSTINISFED